MPFLGADRFVRWRKHPFRTVGVVWKEKIDGWGGGGASMGEMGIAKVAHHTLLSPLVVGSLQISFAAGLGLGLGHFLGVHP